MTKVINGFTRSDVINASDFADETYIKQQIQEGQYLRGERVNTEGMNPLEEFYTRKMREAAPSDYGSVITLDECNQTINNIFNNNNNNNMFYHFDKEGNRKLVASLTEVHLTNIVKKYCKNISNLKSQLGKPLTFDERIAGVEKMDDDDIIDKVRKMSESLSAYLIECYIRDLPVGEYIQKAFGRNEAITLREDLPALTNLDADDDEDTDRED